MADLDSSCFTLGAEPGDDGTTIIVIDDVDTEQRLRVTNQEALAFAAKIMVAASADSIDETGRA